MHPLHRVAVQVFVLLVAVAAVWFGNDWRILLGGGLALPLIAEIPRRRVVDNRPRPEGWNQADETVLRARERLDLRLRQGFWAAWAIGLLVADRAGDGLAEKPAYIARLIGLLACVALYIVLVLLGRRRVSAAIVRGMAETVRGEDRYPSA